MFNLQAHGAANKPDLESLSKLEQDYLKGRDLLSSLVKANADPEVPDTQRLNDEEVIARMWRCICILGDVDC